MEETNPQPVNICGLEQTQNTTDNTNNDNTETGEDELSANHFVFSPSVEPHQKTGIYKDEKDFVASILNDKEPTLLFRGGDFMSQHNVKLEDIFPIQFPFGLGSINHNNQKRPTSVSKADILKHYSQLSLPQFQKADFLLVTCAMYQRLETFKNCIISCKSNKNGQTLSDELSKLSKKDIVEATKCVMGGKKHRNDTINSLFTKVSGMCRAIGHSNECAKDVRHKSFAL